MKAAPEGEMDNLPLLESLFEQYQKDPKQLDPSWQRYFQSLDVSTSLSVLPTGNSGECRIDLLIAAFRRDGFIMARVNPLSGEEPKEIPSLNYQNYGFTDLNKVYPTCGLLPEPTAPLSKILVRLKEIYCGTIGFEYVGIVEPEMERWLQSRIEGAFFDHELTVKQKTLIMEYLNRSELFETFLHTKFVGQKRFSLEGAETLIPMLALILEEGGEQGLQEAVIGMAHRGRLNVITNILNKSIQAVLKEFTDIHSMEGIEGTGDVKYHKGFVGNYLREEQGGSIRLTLSPNPSHLESVDSVVEGQTHAKQFLIGDEKDRNKILPILIHGDAAISGQGVVYETLQLSKLPGYTTGGTVHIVINNQIGFTTIPRDMRSTHYCTDIARAFGIPVFHVNAEDPERCVHIALLAYEIRCRFHCDVFIELNCYRKYGHNESDEPAYTQPVQYKTIKKKKPIRAIYKEQLIKEGFGSQPDFEKMEQDFRKMLQDAHSEISEKEESKKTDLMFVPNDEMLFQQVKTGIPYDQLLFAVKQFSSVPEGFLLHPKLSSLIAEHCKMVENKKPINWAMGEFLAYASLLMEEKPVRLSGQDSARGTFSHRHAVWIDQETSQEYFPLAHLKAGQARFEVINSPLSEMGVLAFEYGYSVSCPHGLTIWEAQFGDFGNGAQVIIDQYIASGEQKWGQKSGITLFLPHGYEGQGPEHSSGRIERFLTLAGHDNMQIVNPTTPAQFFHLLRRQLNRSLIKPLIVFTPKAILRLPACVSPIEELSNGAFHEILDDPAQPKTVRRLVLCSGKIYYDLIAHRKTDDIAIVRIEQLYPLYTEKLQELINKYSSAKECVWAQEEHSNMGAWNYMNPVLNRLLSEKMPLRYVGRNVSATPATGLHALHEQEHDLILKQVFQ